MSNGLTETTRQPSWDIDRPPWGWKKTSSRLESGPARSFSSSGTPLSLKRALFYFDITEINYPYRAFFAEELRAGRFSRWFPGSIAACRSIAKVHAGYLHPFKYLLYPWLPAWQAFNLDTVLSIWLTGTGTYLWLRRHVAQAAALTGCAVFGLSGFMWAHLIPHEHGQCVGECAVCDLGPGEVMVFWVVGGAVLGGLALACQVFAGHLQDSLLTVLLVGLYGFTAPRPSGNGRGRAPLRCLASCRARRFVFGRSVGSLQGITRSLSARRRAGWEDLTFASWHPELLPTLVIREAYGTRARDTDWMDGFYPYHEMNAYMGLIAMVLAVVGAGGIGSATVGPISGCCSLASAGF